jgi:hypothetical protein
MCAKQVVVDEDNTSLQITIGPPYGLVHTVTIDLTDAKSIVQGVVEVLSLSDASTHARAKAVVKSPRKTCGSSRKWRTHFRKTGFTPTLFFQRPRGHGRGDCALPRRATRGAQGG